MVFNIEHMIAILVAAIAGAFLMRFLLFNTNSSCRFILSVLHSLPSFRDCFCRNNQQQPGVVANEAHCVMEPLPTYEIALIISRPPVPELNRPKSHNLTHNRIDDDEQQPPSYEVALDLISAESSRRCCSASQINRPEVAHSNILLSYEDALRNSRPAGTRVW